MAEDERKSSSESQEVCITSKPDDVFINGDSDEQVPEDEPQVPADTLLPEQVLPRKSSFMNKDGSRNTQRKKTVSFSSMPAERKIATGELVSNLTPLNSYY